MGGVAVAETDRPGDALSSAQPAPGMPAGVAAWTTTRAAGSFGLGSDESVGVVMQRWDALLDALGARGLNRLATAYQVHGAAVVDHRADWRGWLRQRGVDGHVSAVPGTALAVTIADCTPVFLAHPRGVIAVLHAGWRGTAAGILKVGLDALASFGAPADECAVHLGPSICRTCYEVGPEVFEALTGTRPLSKGLLDVRAVLADQALALGVRELSTSPLCTRCQRDRFYSHRGGDAGRQLGIIALQSS